MRLPALILLVATMAGCQSAADHRAAVRDPDEKKLTLGVAQREIKKGMSQADIAKVMGSPNLVTRDRTGVETWIYDKVSTEYVYSTSSGGVAGLVLGGGSDAGGIAGGRADQASGAASRTQRTLTVIIKFVEGAVDEFSYNASSF